MRTLLTGEFATATTWGQDYYVQFEVQNASGTWIDVGAALGTHWIVNARWGENIDQSVSAITITLVPFVGGTSMSPLMAASPLNVDDAAAYAPLLEIGRLVRVHVATMPAGVALDAGKYRPIFDGRIDVLGEADSTDGQQPITVQCSDSGAWLMDIEIESTTDRQYGTSTPPGTALETVLQSIIDDNIPSGEPAVTLYKQSSSTFAITPKYTQQQDKLLPPLVALVLDTTGEDLRYRYDASHVSRLTWFNPDRGRTSIDATFGADGYVVQQLDRNLDTVRNAGRIPSPAAPGTFLYNTDTAAVLASRASYRRHFMQLAASPQLTTDAQALSVLDAAINDNVGAPVDAKFLIPFGWFVQLFDRYTFTANGRQYDSDQTLAVVQFEHSIESGRGQTVLSLAGRVIGAYAAWRKRITLGGSVLGPPNVSVSPDGSDDTGMDVTITATPGAGASGTPLVSYRVSDDAGNMSVWSGWFAAPLALHVDYLAKNNVVIQPRALQSDGQITEGAGLPLRGHVPGVDPDTGLVHHLATIDGSGVGATDTPTSYDLSVQSLAVLAADGWPTDGTVLHLPGTDAAAASQIFTPSDSSAASYRTWSASGSLWTAFRGFGDATHADVADSVPYGGVDYTGVVFSAGAIQVLKITAADTAVFDPLLLSDFNALPAKLDWARIQSAPAFLTSADLANYAKINAANAWDAAHTQTFPGGIAVTGGPGITATGVNISVTGGAFIGDLTGNAATVTNGVVTTGSYSNPAWITALAGSKISGPVASASAVPFSGVTYTGLTAGTFLRASAPTLAGFDFIEDSDLPTTIARTANYYDKTTSDGRYINTTTGDARWGRLGASNTWGAFSNSFGGTVTVTGGGGFVDTSGSGFNIPSGGGIFSGNGSGLTSVAASSMAWGGLTGSASSLSPTFAAVTATTFTGTLSGNASTATSAATLTTARTIAGTSFNGSANIGIDIANIGGTTLPAFSGAALTNLAADAITTGFLDIARIPTGPSGVATQSWVTAQGYVTSIPGTYARTDRHNIFISGLTQTFQGGIVIDACAISSDNFVSAVAETVMGYTGGSYKVLGLGMTPGGGIAGSLISLGYDPSGNTGGAFSGGGTDILVRNAARFLMPTPANNDYIVALNWSTSGAVSFPQSVTATSSVNAAQADAGFQLGGSVALYRSGSYNILTTATGNNAIFLGGTGDPGNYYDNTTHRFRTISGATTLGAWDASLLDIRTNMSTTGTMKVGSHLLNSSSARDLFLSSGVSTGVSIRLFDSAGGTRAWLYGDASGGGLLDTSGNWRVMTITSGGTLFGTWDVQGDSANTQMKFRNASGTLKGYVYADGGDFGLLNAGGNWAVEVNGKILHGSGWTADTDFTSPAYYDGNGKQLHPIIAVTALPGSFTGYTDGTFFAITA